MVNRVIYFWGLILVTLFVSAPLEAQSAEAFARVSVSPRQGIVRQPYKVTIEVYSSTWFTSGLQFSNFVMEDAFIIPFTRTLSSISYINNKKYSTLSFYYLVFPYTEGELYIPEIELTANIPPVGEYKGVDRILKTKKQRIVVNPIPNNKDKSIDLVAQSASIKESWDKPLTDLKVGDVVVRQITLNVRGTLPSLISPLTIEEPEFVSLYAKDAVLKDKRDNNSVNGQRIETYSYLFEKEGELIIPEQEIVWCNPSNLKTYKRVLPEKKLVIAPNPDLALLQSLKDSLDAINAPDLTVETQENYPWKRVLEIGLFSLMVLFIVYKMTRREVSRAIDRRHAYLNSEAFYYKKINKAIAQKEMTVILNSIYNWLDFTRQPGQPTSVSAYLNSSDLRSFQLLNDKNKQSDYVLDKQEVTWMKGLVVRLRTAVTEMSLDDKSDGLNP